MTRDLDALDFSSYRGFNGQLVVWRYQALAAHFAGASCLELGSSDGQGTRLLLPCFDAVTAVDGSVDATDRLRTELAGDPRLTVVCSYFEDLDLGRTFDTVLLAHILEHVEDPVAVLEVAARHLAPGGVLIADVPNALSVHRRLGVRLGLLDRVTDLNEADLSIGHRRVYTPSAFRADIERAGFRIQHFGGMFLKVLSNGQTEELFTREQQEALFDLGADLPELAAEIYAVATPAA